MHDSTRAVSQLDREREWCGHKLWTGGSVSWMKEGAELIQGPSPWNTVDGLSPESQVGPSGCPVGNGDLKRNECSEELMVGDTIRWHWAGADPRGTVAGSISQLVSVCRGEHPPRPLTVVP